MKNSFSLWYSTLGPTASYPLKQSGASSSLARCASKKVDVRLPEKGNSNSHGARPFHTIITMI